MSLPKDFLDKMQTLLKEEYEAFINSYEQEKSLGLRVNALKTTLDQFETLNKFDLKSNMFIHFFTDDFWKYLKEE